MNVYKKGIKKEGGHCKQGLLTRWVNSQHPLYRYYIKTRVHQNPGSKLPWAVDPSSTWGMIWWSVCANCTLICWGVWGDMPSHHLKRKSFTETFQCGWYLTLKFRSARRCVKQKQKRAQRGAHWNKNKNHTHDHPHAHLHIVLSFWPINRAKFCI